MTHLGQSAKQPALPRGGDRLEPGVHPERPQDPADVVADGLALDAEPVGDLCGGLAVREMVQHLELARGQTERRAAAA